MNMKAIELREKDPARLQELLYKELQEQFNLCMQKGGSAPLERPSEIKKTRRNIARIKTVMREKKRVL